jgi:hypothetical protein
MPDRKKLSPSDLLDALRDMAEDDALLDEADRIQKLSDAEVAADVKAQGGDPAWKAKARARLSNARRAMADVPKTPASMPRKEILARIDAARKNPRLSSPVAAFFRKRKPEETSDEELRELLDELLLLEAVEDDADGSDGEGSR